MKLVQALLSGTEILLALLALLRLALRGQKNQTCPRSMSRLRGSSSQRGIEKGRTGPNSTVQPTEGRVN